MIGPPRRYSTRLHLFGLAAAVVVPLIAFAALVVYRYAQTEQVRIEQEAVRVATLAEALVDAELMQLIAKLEALTSSSALARENLQDFHAEAARLTEGRDETIILRDLEVQQFFNSKLPYGAQLPKGPPFTAEERAGYAKGRPSVSDVYSSPRSGEPRIVMALPILREGVPKYVIGITIPTSRILRAARPAVPPGYILGVGDRKGTYVARSERHDELTGKPGLPEYIGKIIGHSGSFRSLNFEGRELLAGYTRSEMSGWFFSANIPTATLRAPLISNLSQLAVFGVACLIASGFLAILFSQTIARAASALAEKARLLGEGQEVRPVRSHLAEFTQISDALVDAGEALAERSRERGRAEAQRQLLVHELNHRVKNSLAIAQSIASQTLRTARSLLEARSALSSRLVSLGHSHDILTRENWEGANVEDIVAQSIEPYGAADRIRVDGSHARLSSSLSLTLALVLHELMTNAAKYGALSSDSGTIAITWRRIENQEPGHRLFLRFEESGGPLVQAPSHHGFGARLFAASFASPAQGRLTIRYETTGVICEIEMESLTE